MLKMIYIKVVLTIMLIAYFSSMSIAAMGNKPVRNKNEFSGLRIVDIITKKQQGIELSENEIAFFVDGVTNSSIPDYQISAFLMTVFFKGMTDTETALLTRHMTQSGDMADLSKIDGIKVDKHSTGGVGDKTTLIITPIVAACGGKVAKMSGRGLAHTGGTVDKLESIPGLRTELRSDEFFDIVNRVGASVIGQSSDFAPADKKLYALRDVTGTVPSIPLIASSIMSKKLAAGSDCILLDVKTGSGAFMKDTESALELAKVMVAIGEHEGKKTVAIITDMDTPLGNAIGNSLEVVEVVATLQGKGPADLTELCLLLAAEMLEMSGKGSLDECKTMARNALATQAAFSKFKEMVAAQGGDTSVLDDPAKFKQAEVAYDVRATADGYISQMNTENCGYAAALLGAGRLTKESALDHSAGIVLKAKTGEYVKKGDVLATLYCADKALIPNAEKQFLSALTFSETQPEKKPLIRARVDRVSSRM